ncbi:MAG: hypothetical protein R2838_26655 [Caldilineaceae bacterium]
MYHVSGVKRPQGGSGMLTQALARYDPGPRRQIIAGAPVARILTGNGRAPWVRRPRAASASQQAVVSGAHIVTTMQMLEESVVPAPGAAWWTRRASATASA